LRILAGPAVDITIFLIRQCTASPIGGDDQAIKLLPNIMDRIRLEDIDKVKKPAQHDN
jgi:hypothetical protein